MSVRWLIMAGHFGGASVHRAGAVCTPASLVSDVPGLIKSLA
ncbi:hypothetical protein PAMC26510_02935 [Caballeronia sordidicola]|uniref:Uncharacterized protein n=1 Tax=Caballeronia sordidicola TaxID=196367 RepID=A0A242NAU8_CABSO|nr:hypothetical protein PAMC26510_02935 [Caballeronia sordidicola]